MKMRTWWILTSLIGLQSCTTGSLDYLDQSGERKQACEFEFVGLPHVDRYALEYALSVCAKSVQQHGGKIDREQAYLLNLDLTVPAPPCDQIWSHDKVKTAYREQEITAKEYGYLVAHIDLGFAQVNQCH